MKVTLRRLNELLAQAGWERVGDGQHGRYPEWYAEIQEWKAKYPLRFKDSAELTQPQYAIQLF